MEGALGLEMQHLLVALLGKNTVGGDSLEKELSQ